MTIIYKYTIRVVNLGLNYELLVLEEFWEPLSYYFLTSITREISEEITGLIKKNREESTLRLNDVFWGAGVLFGFPGSRLGPLKHCCVELTTFARQN
jgi:hypothetical protein